MSGVVELDERPRVRAFITPGQAAAIEAAGGPLLEGVEVVDADTRSLDVVLGHFGYYGNVDGLTVLVSHFLPELDAFQCERYAQSRSNTRRKYVEASQCLDELEQLVVDAPASRAGALLCQLEERLDGLRRDVAHEAVSRYGRPLAAQRLGVTPEQLQRWFPANDGSAAA